ncbi:hypothetical protein [Neisseria animaloris]|nr:hypothetical protein [Neisseria animaloris]
MPSRILPKSPSKVLQSVRPSENRKPEATFFRRPHIDNPPPSPC